MYEVDGAKTSDIDGVGDVYEKSRPPHKKAIYRAILATPTVMTLMRGSNGPSALTVLGRLLSDPACRPFVFAEQGVERRVV